MYVDDTVIFTHGKTAKEVAIKLTEIKLKDSTWLNQCCLQLNVAKTFCMFFSECYSIDIEQDIFMSGETSCFRIQIPRCTYKLKSCLQDT